MDGLCGLRNKTMQILRLQEGAGLLFWLGPVAVAVASDRNLCLGEASHLSELFRLLRELERLVPVNGQLRLPRAAWGYGLGAAGEGACRWRWRRTKPAPGAGRGGVAACREALSALSEPRLDQDRREDAG
ncbi:MAG: hypothetical protein N2447_01225 [Thermoanaerobaculum sp.]|nr:hypothetical protein [Thermoanaerobaculum sp.]